MSIRNKVVISFIIFGLLAVSLTGFSAFTKAKENLGKQAIAFLHSLNSQKAQRLQLWLESVSHNLELLGHGLLHEGQTTGGGESSTYLMQKHLQAGMELGVFTEIFLLSVPGGELVASTTDAHVGKLMANRDFYREGQKYTYVEGVHFSMTLMQPSMVVSTPIKNSQGEETIAVLGGRLNLQKLSEIIKQRSSHWNSENSYLVNTQNFFITNPSDGSDFMLRKTVFTKGVTEAIEGREGTSWYNDYHGTPVLGDYLYLDKYKLIQITEISEEEFDSPILRMQISILGIGFAILFFSLLLGLSVALLLLRPLTEFVEKVEVINADHLEYDHDETAPYEISRLSLAFSSMVERLRTTLVSRDKLSKEIEHRKKAEERLQSTMLDLKRSNEELEQFAYVASHDLQEPLRMVTSYNQLLADRLKDQLDEKTKKYINYSIDGASRMQSLIQDLLSYSRITTKGNEFKEVDCAVVFAEAMINLEVLIHESSTLVISDELPVIWGDQLQLVQLFQNLISNGVKFRRTDVAPMIHIGATKEEGGWLFSFQDNGIGIEESHRKRIFVIFKRLHTREEYEGTGIGLALCKRIVQRHHGKIWVTSEPGKGTTFWIRLPQQ